MDYKVILCILAGVLIVTVCGFYVLFRRLNRLEAASVQLQRFLLMSRTQQETMPPERKVPVQPATSPTTTPTGPRQRPQNPMGNLNTVLPMMNTFMTMFQGNDAPEPEEINDRAKEMVQEENKRRGLEKEIEKELGELATSEVKEGRVEDDDVEEEEISNDNPVPIEHKQETPKTVEVS